MKAAPCGPPSVRLVLFKMEVPITLRPVQADDEAFLYQVYWSTREEEFAPLPLDDAQKEHLMRLQFDAQRSSYAAQFPHSEHSIILLDGEPAGRIWVNESAGEIRIVDLAVLTAFRGRGVGGTVVRRVMERAAQARKPLRHVVLKFNENALKFDLGLGYVITKDDGLFIEMEWTAK